MQQAAVAPASFHRLQHTETGLYVRLTCIPAPCSQAPRVVVRLTTVKHASRFVSREAAEQCFARYIGPAPLEIVRGDA